MTGDTAHAATLYREAATLTANGAERRYLLTEAERADGADGADS
ncbi:hypothetical protein ACFQVA_22235 [Actinomadura keratinilytica]